MTSTANRSWIVSLALVMGLTITSLPLRAETNTAKITTDTFAASLACLQWQPSGVCFWLRCSLIECHVETSIKYFHYAPDLVVSTYHSIEQHPWTDFGRALAQSTQSSAKALVGSLVDSAGTRTRDDGRDRNHPFRDADAIGHPIAASAFTGLTCPMAAVTALHPYFQSHLDALVWRALLPVEMLYPQSLVPGVREIGNWPLNTWGNVYPRDGRITQPEEPKAHAVIATRVGDIVTRAGQPHVYSAVALGTTIRHRQLIWLPPPLIENAPQTGKWQMLDPHVDAACYAFGINDSLLPLSWSDGRGSVAGGAVFNLWRPYRCCEIEGLFIGSIDWF